MNKKRVVRGFQMSSDQSAIVFDKDQIFYYPQCTGFEDGSAEDAMTRIIPMTLVKLLAQTEFPNALCDFFDSAQEVCAKSGTQFMPKPISSVNVPKKAPDQAKKKQPKKNLPVKVDQKSVNYDTMSEAECFAMIKRILDGDDQE